MSIFDRADLIGVDSLTQCLEYGDLSYANIEDKTIIELGTLLKQGMAREEEWITIADLTGSAIVDLQVAKSIALN